MRPQEFFMRGVLISISMLALLFTSCIDNKGYEEDKDVSPDAVFFEYKVWGEETDSLVTLYLQFRLGGKNGKALVLQNPSSVMLDGDTLEVDSARLTGAYYEIRRPLNSFSGNHSIVFTDLNGKQYKEDFRFIPFILKTKIPAVINRGDIHFDFEGFEKEDYITLIATDTSFRSRDIQKIDTIKNGRLTITAEELDDLVNGPVNIQFYRDVDKKVKNGTKEGGRISVSYGLQREFELRD